MQARFDSPIATSPNPSKSVPPNPARKFQVRFNPPFFDAGIGICSIAVVRADAAQHRGTATMAKNTPWTSVLEFFSDRQGRNAAKRPSLGIESLEDRTVPAMLDLSTVGALGQINGAIFQQNATQPAGSGVIHAFVRIHAQGAAQTVEQGYNTNARPLQYDENNSPQFTRALQLSAIPTVDIGGVVYREFLLDINENQASPQLSLDELRLYVGSAPNLTRYDPTTDTLSGLTPVYDMGGGNWVKLDSGLNPGLGKANMIVDIPDADFSAQSRGTCIPNSA
jgi:hypothetical protein